MTQLLFKAHNITKSYDGVKIIEDVNIEINQGQIVCLIGTSGVGKTTLFQVLSGLTKPDTGEVILDDKNIVGKAGEVSYMLQKDMLLPFKTIIDNVCLPFRIKGLMPWIAREKVRSSFKQFGLEGCEKKYPAQLSGGMRQRAAFMRTYFMGKKLMLLDEPFSALDEITKTNMYSWFLNITKELSLTTIFISHSLDEAITLADRILVMTGKPGHITAEIKIEKGDDFEEFTTSDKYMEYKRQLKNLLK